MRSYIISRRRFKDEEHVHWTEPRSGSYQHETIEKIEAESEQEAFEYAIDRAEFLQERLFVSVGFSPIYSVYPDGSVGRYATGSKRGWVRGPFTEGLAF